MEPGDGDTEVKVDTEVSEEVAETKSEEAEELLKLAKSLTKDRYMFLLAKVPHVISHLIKSVLDPDSSNVQTMAIGILLSNLTEIFIDEANKRLQETDEEYLKPHLDIWKNALRTYMSRLFDTANEAKALQDKTSRMKLVSYGRSMKYCFEKIVAWDEPPEQLAIITKVSATNIVDGDSQIVKEWDCLGIQKQTSRLVSKCLQEANAMCDAATAFEMDLFHRRAEIFITSVYELTLFARSVAAVTYNGKFREYMNNLVNVILDSSSLVIVTAKSAPASQKRKDNFVKQVSSSKKNFYDTTAGLMLLMKVIGEYAVANIVYSNALRAAEKAVAQFASYNEPKSNDEKEIPQTTFYQLEEVIKELWIILDLMRDFHIVFSGGGAYNKEVNITKSIINLCNQTVDLSALLTDASVHMIIARAIHTLQSSLEAVLCSLYYVGRTSMRLSEVHKLHAHQVFSDHGKTLSSLAMLHIQLASSVQSLSAAVGEVCHAIHSAVEELQTVIDRCGSFLENPTLRHTQTEPSPSEAEFGIDKDYSIFESPDSKESIILMEGISEEEEGNWAIKGGTLEKLVERVTTERFIDLKFMKAFLTTYRSFSSETELFKLLVRRYNVPKRSDMPESEWKKKVAIPIQLRVCNVLKYWIENFFYDFSETLLRQLQVFIRNSLTRDGYKKFANQLQKAINRKTLPALGFTRDRLSELSLSFREGFTVKYISSNILNDFDLEIVARELTKIDFIFYKSIQPAEFLNQAWNNEKLKHRAPNLLATIARFNKTSNWVSSCVMWNPDIKSRSKMITKLIQLAEHLRRLNNFSSLMAVLSALNSSAVHRMKYAWELVPQKYLESYEEMGRLMDSHQSFKMYRDEVRNIQPPCVPYLGIYLSDLTFIEEGNPDFVGENLINFHKRKLYYDVLRKIQLYQQDAYPETEADKIVFGLLSELPYIQHDELFVLSLLHEPRGCDRADLM